MTARAHVRTCICVYVHSARFPTNVRFAYWRTYVHLNFRTRVMCARTYVLISARLGFQVCMCTPVRACVCTLICGHDMLRHTRWHRRRRVALDSVAVRANVRRYVRAYARVRVRTCCCNVVRARAQKRARGCSVCPVAHFACAHLRLRAGSYLPLRSRPRRSIHTNSL